MHSTEERVETTTRTDEIWAERERWVARGVSTYTHIVPHHAHGAEVWDVDGKRYIDFAGGIGTLNVGHTPETVVAAIQKQASELIHMCFSVGIYEGYVHVAKRLCGLTPGDFTKKAMLVNSGAEAVENAVKIARAATGRPNIIAFRNAFHGRTLMGMSLTGKDRPYKVGFGPFSREVYHADFPYPYRDTPVDVASGEALERMLQDEVPAATVAAIIVEPVQGEGGFLPVPTTLMRKIREICDRHGIVLIADEIQTGFGRTGTMWAIERHGVVPDIMVLAKSIAAGMPLAAVVGRADLMDAPNPGGIGGTYGGNPVACAAALAVLDLYEDGALVRRAAEIGERITARLREMQGRYELIGEVRGQGPMAAIELVSDRETKTPATEATAAILYACHAAGLVLIKAGLFDNVIRILVPFAVTDEQLSEGLDILEREIATAQG